MATKRARRAQRRHVRDAKRTAPAPMPAAVAAEQDAMHARLHVREAITVLENIVLHSEDRVLAAECAEALRVRGLPVPVRLDS